MPGQCPSLPNSLGEFCPVGSTHCPPCRFNIITSDFLAELERRRQEEAALAAAATAAERAAAQLAERRRLQRVVTQREFCKVL